MRAGLQVEINELVEELAPAIFDDFYTNRIVPPSARPPPSGGRPQGGMTRRRSTYGPQGQGTFFTHPMSESSSSSTPRFTHTTLGTDSDLSRARRLGRRIPLRLVAVSGAKEPRRRVRWSDFGL